MHITFEAYWNRDHFTVSAALKREGSSVVEYRFLGNVETTGAAEALCKGFIDGYKFARAQMDQIKFGDLTHG